MLRKRILDTKDEQVGTAALACSAGLKAGVGQFVLSLLWRSAHDTRHRQQSGFARDARNTSLGWTRITNCTG
jgi:hypothetical protein